MMCWSGSSPAGCISIRVTATLSVMSDSLPLQSSRNMFGVLLWIRGFGYGYGYDYYIYLPLMLAWVNVLFVYACLVCRCKHSI
jgi:hypothetical protein